MHSPQQRPTKVLSLGSVPFHLHKTTFRLSVAQYRETQDFWVAIINALLSFQSLMVSLSTPHLTSAYTHEYHVQTLPDHSYPDILLVSSTPSRINFG